MNKDEMLETILRKLDAMEIKQRDWAGLTESETDELWNCIDDCESLIRQVQEKLKERNGG